jgi:signal transduction histidine kinase
MKETMITDISSLQDRQSGHTSLPIEDEAGELNNILQKIVENCAALLEVSNCSVTLADTEGFPIVMRAALRNQGRSHRPTRSRLSEGMISWVAEHREPLIINDIRLDPRFKRLGRTLLGSMLCVPLIYQDEFMGTLTASSQQTGAFSPRQVLILTIFAEQAVLAITNARLAEQLRDAIRVKAKFLSMVTHELRSPLNSINGYLDLVLTGVGGELNQQQQEFLQRARAGSEHLYALLEDLLLISRSDAGQLHLNHEEISLEEIVTSALEELEITAADNEITINVDIDDDIPPLWADSVRLQQVLRNLISNALRFTSTGGNITISAHYRDDNASAEYIEISVCDTGCGIAAEYQQLIFERFYQVPRPNGGRAGGQGLGLAVVKLIIELYGGRVAVESTPGQGSTFSFTLPCLAI